MQGSTTHISKYGTVSLAAQAEIVHIGTHPVGLAAAIFASNPFEGQRVVLLGRHG